MNEHQIDISGVSKAEVLAALYNASKPQGMGAFQFNPADMSANQAEHLLKQDRYFDYLFGRVMKIDLSQDVLDPRLYDRDNGSGAALQAIKHLLKKVA